MKIALIGNPNCGKTTIFNALTGTQQRIGNWPGVTVEKKSGWFRFENHQLEIIDLPGIYSFDEEISEDEKVAKEYILSGDANVFVNIIDSTHFERNLYLTLLLLEMGIPMIVVLNMKDLAANSGVRINPSSLQEILGVPVISIKGTDKEDIKKFKKLLIKSSIEDCVSEHRIQFRASIEKVISQWAQILDSEVRSHCVSSRWLALDLLLENKNSQNIPRRVLDKLQIPETIRKLKSEWKDEVDVLVAEDVYSTYSYISKKSVSKRKEKRTFPKYSIQ